MFTTNKKDDQGLLIRAYEGDAKVLLAFSLPDEKRINLAGFTIACTPKGKPTYYLYNQLQLENPEKHAQNKNEPSNSSINAPIQKFRWLHVPGGFHQMDKVFYGSYAYTVTPRYFNEEGILQTIDKKLSSDVVVDVKPFSKGSIDLGFTRGFVQSQGFVHHFGPNAPFKPKSAKLLFSTDAPAGKNSNGDEYTFKDEYVWSGYTAREKVFKLLQDVQNNEALTLDVFAYDLNEPDVLKIFLELGKEGRIRIILDNATLHHNKDKATAEDQFEEEFTKVAKDTESIKRGKFKRFQHNKIFIVKQDDKAIKVLSGSTNFSVTGMYVNSNHIVVFNNEMVADLYSKVFEEAWTDNVKPVFAESGFATKAFPFEKMGLPQMSITFSPHNQNFASDLLDNMVGRIKEEKSSVLFAVMAVDTTSTGPVSPALIDLHQRTDIFSYGITDSNKNIFLYKPSSRTGVEVTGKPGTTLLPPPFDKEVSVGIGHQVHHKFIVCGFNQPDAVVWFGSSNLALGGEESNGDNLIEVHDEDIATVFAIEAIALVDHFHFRDAHVNKNEGKSFSGPFYLYPNSKWSDKYYDPEDLYCLDRLLFAGEAATSPQVIAAPSAETVHL